MDIRLCHFLPFESKSQKEKIKGLVAFLLQQVIRYMSAFALSAADWGPLTVKVGKRTDPWGS
jgi:hypothetical protein